MEGPVTKVLFYTVCVGCLVLELWTTPFTTVEKAMALTVGAFIALDQLKSFMGRE